MTPTEDTPTAVDVAKADALARATLIDAEATAALGAAGCRSIVLFRPHIIVRLAAVHIGEGDGLRVFGVDAKGAVRTGPKGPMTVDDVLSELLTQNPSWQRFFT